MRCLFPLPPLLLLFSSLLSVIHPSASSRRGVKIKFAPAASTARNARGESQCGGNPSSGDGRVHSRRSSNPTQPSPTDPHLTRPRAHIRREPQRRRRWPLPLPQGRQRRRRRIRRVPPGALRPGLLLLGRHQVLLRLYFPFPFRSPVHLLPFPLRLRLRLLLPPGTSSRLRRPLPHNLLLHPTRSRSTPSPRPIRQREIKIPLRLLHRLLLLHRMHPKEPRAPPAIRRIRRVRVRVRVRRLPHRRAINIRVRGVVVVIVVVAAAVCGGRSGACGRARRSGVRERRQRRGRKRDRSGVVRVLMGRRRTLPLARRRRPRTRTRRPRSPACSHS
ncbi:hypothetical protein C8R46DRAFT_378786 [Mycena filopes]|nr:hypothetical protein C8R46DRAFT_378786 [Mycena filopes]